MPTRFMVSVVWLVLLSALVSPQPSTENPSPVAAGESNDMQFKQREYSIDSLAWRSSGVGRAKSKLRKKCPTREDKACVEAYKTCNTSADCCDFNMICESTKNGKRCCIRQGFYCDYSQNRCCTGLNGKSMDCVKSGKKGNFQCRNCVMKGYPCGANDPSLEPQFPSCCNGLNEDNVCRSPNSTDYFADPMCQECRKAGEACQIRDHKIGLFQEWCCKKSSSSERMKCVLKDPADQSEVKNGTCK